MNNIYQLFLLNLLICLISFNASADIIVNAGPNQTISCGSTATLAGSITGEGITTGTWSTYGDGMFTPSNTFPGAVTYTPGVEDNSNHYVILKLVSDDPNAICSASGGGYGLVILTIDCPYAIPTLSQWGLIILSILLATVGTLYILRRRSARVPV